MLSFFLSSPSNVQSFRSHRVITGLSIAQVRLIFRLHEEIAPISQPLEYVQWFIPLRETDPLLGGQVFDAQLSPEHLYYIH